MENKKVFHDAILELALSRGDWFLARNLVRPLEEKLGESVSPIAVGHYLSRMSECLLLESNYIKEKPLERIKEYCVIKWNPIL